METGWWVAYSHGSVDFGRVKWSYSLMDQDVIDVRPLPGWSCGKYSGEFSITAMRPAMQRGLHIPILWRGDAFGNEVGRWEFKIPAFLPVTLTGLIPVAYVVGIRRFRCRMSQLCVCVHCGYDLRASKDKCPECGAPAPARPTVAGATAAGPQ